jgi:hypothetical protein
MTVSCLAEDAHEVRDSLEGWFCDCDLSLANLRIQVSEPTPEEDARAVEAIDPLPDDEDTAEKED